MIWEYTGFLRYGNCINFCLQQRFNGWCKRAWPGRLRWWDTIAAFLMPCSHHCSKLWKVLCPLAADLRLCAPHLLPAPRSVPHTFNTPGLRSLRSHFLWQSIFMMPRQSPTAANVAMEMTGCAPNCSRERAELRLIGHARLCVCVCVCVLVCTVHL